VELNKIHKMNKSEILKYVGNLSQIGDCRHYILEEGWGRGMRAVDISTGNGLQYTVLPDRGLDISLASFRGVNLVYLTCNGETHPSYYEPEGTGWLHTFTGGLLTTCGLTYFGSPCNDEGEMLGLHGRYSTIPVKMLNDLSDWEGNSYCYKIKGIAEEGFLFGRKLRMEREISSVRGQNTIHIKDKITNFGASSSPYTILYHMNFGYPFLSEDTELVIDPLETKPRDADAEQGLNEFRKFIKPQPSYREQVFYHTIKKDNQGYAAVIIRNKKKGMEVCLKFNVKSLPYLTQWKMMGYGEYVLGIEPCNVPSKSRATLREENRLPELMPGETTVNDLDVTVSSI
jgi:hypothetical protein